MSIHASKLRAPYFAGKVDAISFNETSLPGGELVGSDTPEGAAWALAVACAKAKANEARDAEEAAAFKVQEALAASKHAEETYFRVLKAAAEKAANDEREQAEQEVKNAIEAAKEKNIKQVSAWKASSALADSRVAMKAEKIRKSQDGKSLVAVASLTIDYSSDEEGEDGGQVSSKEFNVCFPSFCF
jgi:hypothetical protein